MWLWVVYDHPADMPEDYVARLFESDTPTGVVLVSPNVDVLRRYFLRRGLVRLPPAPTDDPVILEVWI